ncbi:AraC family transcriptional regulator [Nonomuraea sp. NPDC005983]|uniref:AraC family transcriptional regulator n=1 Tax=Nonomuraea sp. NPDC005983 TaxID=3155595 RepID=UPI0033B37DCC
MDLLDDYLSTVRAHGALFAQSIGTPPWSLRFVKPAPLMLVTMLRGDGWIVPARGRPLPLGRGSVGLVLAEGSGACTLADQPETAPQVFINADNLCYAAGEDPASAGDHFKVATRTYGAADGSDVVVTAAYSMHGNVCRRLLHSLPGALVVPHEPQFAPLLDLLATEIAGNRPGQQTTLDRLLDLLLVRVLRSWFAHPDARPPAGYLALADPRIGPVLHLLHRHPDRPWTVATLAGAAGMSRAAFARRFTALVGRPPLTYLTDWRMTLAADLLQEPATTIAAVARRVGYRDPFTFSAAFKRVRGTAPSNLRHRHAT